MLTRRRILTASLSLPLVLTGCKINTINSFPTHPANLRAVNVMPGVPAVNVSVAGSLTFAGVLFESFTTYAPFDNTRTTVAVSLPGSTSVITQADYDLTGEVSYTLVVYGSNESPATALLADTSFFPNPGNFGLRFANVAIGSPLVDVYVTAPGVDITTVSPNSLGLQYAAATNLFNFSTGTIQIRLTQNGTFNLLYDSGPLTFADTSAVNMLFYSNGSTALINAELVPISTVGGPQGVANNTLARVLVVNAAPQTPSADYFIDNVGLAAAVAYPTSSVYNTIPPGTHTFTVFSTDTPGAVIATVTGQIPPAMDASLVLAGNAGSTTAFLLADNNLPPASGNVRVRYVNASADVPALDVLLNGTKQAGGIPQNTASGYFEFGNGTYTIVFADPTTGAALLTLSNASLADGQVVNYVVAGPAAQLQLITILNR